MTAVDWLWILHPALAVVLVYPLLGMVVRLAWQTRQRRVARVKHSVSVGADHSGLGRWLSAAVVVLVLLALAVVIGSQAAVGIGGVRSLQLVLAFSGTAVSLMALLRSQAAAARLTFSLMTWLGVLGLGAQPEVWRLSDNPLQGGFWQSHYWGGVALTGLVLFALGAQREIQRDLRLRRLHVTASVLVAVLFVLQGITGTRDLLEIPLSWQKPAMARCDFVLQRCAD